MEMKVTDGHIDVDRYLAIADRLRALGAQRISRERRHEIDIAAARAAFRQLMLPLAAVLALCLALLSLAGCGFGQIGPETMISADTPCGHIDYRSTKDQAAPGAVCRIDRDGATYLEMGAGASSGISLVANMAGQLGAAVVTLAGKGAK